MFSEPSAAIIILNWNGFDDTVECLQSLRQVTYTHYKVVLVDNGSANNEGKNIKNLFPEIHLIENATNRGFAGGCNNGIAWAMDNSFDYIITLNNDCLVEPDWLTNLVAGLVASGADFASSRIMYYPEKDLICSDVTGCCLTAPVMSYMPCRNFSCRGQYSLFSAPAALGQSFRQNALSPSKYKKTSFLMSFFSHTLKISTWDQDCMRCRSKGSVFPMRSSIIRNPKQQEHAPFLKFISLKKTEF